MGRKSKRNASGRGEKETRECAEKRGALPLFREDSLTLARWIDEVGVETVASLLHVQISSVYHWRRGKCCPTDSQKILIRKYSKNAVTYASMVENRTGF